MDGEMKAVCAYCGHEIDSDQPGFARLMFEHVIGCARNLLVASETLEAELQSMADEGCRWSGLAGDYSVKNSATRRMCRPEIGMKLCYSCRAQAALDAATAIAEKKD